MTFPAQVSYKHLAMRALGIEIPVAEDRSWESLARPLQQRNDGWSWSGQLPPPGNWRIWLFLAGRGAGKSWTGAQAVCRVARERPGCRIALVARTSADARDVMVEGVSGIVAVSPDDFMPNYEPSKRRVTWPNGSMATTFSADKPDQLRGPQHHFAWADELAAWHYAEAWDHLQFGLRLGANPRVIITTTPRPTSIIREMVEEARTGDEVVLTTASTWDNAHNLSRNALDALRKRYEGTQLGRQELYAEILDSVEGALWTREIIERSRRSSLMPGHTETPGLARIVVGVDPATTSEEDSSETGIVVSAIDSRGHGYVLDDRSLRASPRQWAQIAIAAFDEWQADRVIVEVNQGGEMVSHTLRTERTTIPITAVRAARGKMARAEPVSALYEQGRISHAGAFPELEDQMCTWVPGEPSPDRMDAMVWCMHHLFPMRLPASRAIARNFYRRQDRRVRPRQ